SAVANTPDRETTSFGRVRSSRRLLWLSGENRFVSRPGYPRVKIYVSHGAPRVPRWYLIAREVRGFASVMVGRPPVTSPASPRRPSGAQALSMSDATEEISTQR